MFLLTWSRQKGLGSDDFFPGFLKMQAYLNSGYRQYQLAAKNPRSFVAPAGIAYQLMYDETILGEGTEISSPFSGLYPSVQGSYLSVRAIYAAYTGLSVAELEWAPEGIGAERRDYLQSKADEAVFDDDTFYPCRWDDLDSTNPNDGPQFEPSAGERFTAPRTVYAMMDMLLLAAIVCALSM
jgi:hypothetical protein